MNNKIFLAIFFILLSSTLVFAEQTGTIDFSTFNRTIVTGLYAYTVPDYCIEQAECYGYVCYYDYDNTSESGYAGWCQPPSLGKCIHGNYNIGSLKSVGYKLCYGTNQSVECKSTGIWQFTFCSYGCDSTTSLCKSAPANTTTYVPPSSPPSVPVSKIIVNIQPKDINMTQGFSALNFVTIKNNGDNDLGNLRITLSGIESSYYKVSPSSYTEIEKTKTKTFTMNFTIPSDADVGTYNVTIKATTNESSANVSTSFKLSILPSNETIQSELIPAYNDYLSALGQLEKNITGMGNKGYNITEVRQILENLKAKLNNLNSSITNKDYLTAYELIDDVDAMINDANSKMQNAEKEAPKQGDLTIILAAVIIVAAAVIILLYLFWPTEEMGFHHQKGWIIEMEHPFKKLISKLKWKRGEKKIESRKTMEADRRREATSVNAIVSQREKKIKKEEKFKYEYRE